MLVLPKKYRTRFKSQLEGLDQLQSETALRAGLRLKTLRVHALEEEVSTLRREEEQQIVEHEHEVEQLESKITELEAEPVRNHPTHTETARLASAELLAADLTENLREKMNAFSDAKERVAQLEQELRKQTNQMTELSKVCNNLRNQENSKATADAKLLAQSMQKTCELEEKLLRKRDQLAAMK